MVEQKQFFVTGATGYVGGHLIELLLDEGHEVVALARNPSEATELDDKGVELVKGDILDPATLRHPMTGVDGVFHLAALYDMDPADPDLMEQVNVEGTRNVLEVARDLDISKTVYTSTLAVNSDTNGQLVDESYRFDGRHLTTYDRTKWEAHYDVVMPFAQNGLSVVTVLPGVIYGPGDRSPLGEAFLEYLSGNLPAISKKTKFCWSHVEDIARAHYRAFLDGNPGEEYIIAGHPASLVEVFELAEHITGIDAPRALPSWIFSGLAVGATLIDRIVSMPDRYSPEMLRILAGRTYLGDNSKAQAELGIDHRPLEEGLRETLEYELDRMSN